MNDRPLNLFIGESVRARLMRGFLPLPLLIIIIAGWFETISVQFFKDHVLGSAIVTFFSLFVLSFIILKLAKDMGNDIDHIFEFRKEAEILLRESELHFRTLADSGQALIWTSGIDKKCNYFNKPWLDFTGRSLEQELGDGWIEGVHPDDINYCVEIYIKAFDNRELFSMDYRLRFNDGSFRWIQDNGTPRFNTRGEFIGYIGHCLDITEYKLNENRIKESEEKYRSIFENSNVAILLTATDESILSANNYACLLFEMTEQEICMAGRKGIIDLSDPRLPILLEERQRKGHTSGRLTFIKKNGSKFESEISSTIFSDREGQKRTSMVIRDLTEQIEAEREIHELNKELGQKVKERTIELEQKNSDLERINRLFIGRELRMIELKNRLTEVEEKLKSITGPL
jgi:PAS domain S-box-containing protein